ncbi:hypothetical protein V6R21_25060 [Limibacter armeniacum]|uniref:hypothetical protein n=1 Tax=Limibacter armeniacum TaxID=466084 RepID=UPI002FE5B40A
MDNKPHVLHITYVDANRRKYVCDNLTRARKLLNQYITAGRVHNYGLYEYDKKAKTQGRLVDRATLQPLSNEVQEYYILHITFVDGNRRKFECKGKHRINAVVKQFLGRIHNYGVYEYDKGRQEQGREVVRKNIL